jgi:hypothetical protein
MGPRRRDRRPKVPVWGEAVNDGPKTALSPGREPGFRGAKGGVSGRSAARSIVRLTIAKRGPPATPFAKG